MSDNEQLEKQFKQNNLIENKIIKNFRSDLKFLGYKNNILNSQFTDCDFIRLKTHNVDFKNINYYNCLFYENNFDQVNFYKNIFNNVTFTNTYFSRINTFQNTNLYGTSFIDTCGSIINFNQCKLEKTIFKNSKIESLRFLNSKIHNLHIYDTVFDKININNSSISNIKIKNSLSREIIDNSIFQINKYKMALFGLKCDNCGDLYDKIYKIFGHL
jgi:uncharacterized protein YjbI with pentapeptide repeats